MYALVSDMAIFVLKMDVKLQLTNFCMHSQTQKSQVYRHITNNNQR